MLSKVFVNIKTVLQSHCTQCLYWLNFFFWAYVKITVNKILYKPYSGQLSKPQDGGSLNALFWR